MRSPSVRVIPLLLCLAAPRVVDAQEGAPAAYDIAVRPTEGLLRAGEARQLRVYVVDASGRPLPGASLAADARGARIDAVETDLPGAWTAIVTPEEGVTSARLRFTAGAAVEEVDLPVLPTVRPPLEVTLAADTLVLGTRPSVTVTVDARVPGWSAPSAENLRWITNVGGVEGVREVEPGLFEAAYVPPPTRYPQVALIGVAVGEGEAFRVGWDHLPLIGRTEDSFNTEPGARVEAEVAGRRFGPVKADQDGRARLTIEVPPGTDRITVTAVAPGGGTAVTALPLAPPSWPRMAALVDHPGLAPEGVAQVSTFAVDASGAPLAVAPSELRVDVGRLDLRADGRPGVLVGQLTAPAQAGPLQLRWRPPGLAEGEPGLDLLRVTVAEGRPERLALSVSAEALRVDDPPAQLEVQVLDGRGLPASGGKLALDTSLGVVSPPGLVATGRFVAALTPPRELESPGALESTGAVSARLTWPQGDGAPHTLEVYPPVTVLDPARRPEGLAVPARVLDGRGLPLGGLNVNGRVLEGPGSLAGGVSDAGGWVTLVYQPGEGLGGAPPAGITRLQVLLEDMPLLRRDLLLLVTPGGDEGFDRPPPPPDPRRADVSASALFTVKAGRVKQVQVSVQPNALFIGGNERATVRVRLVDGSGNLVMDPGMTIDAQAGLVGPVRVTEDGFHLATYTPPLTGEPGADRLSVQGGVEPFAGGTEVFLDRRRDTLLVTSRLGLVTNLRQYTSPIATMTGFAKLPVGTALYALVGGSYHPITLDFVEPGEDGSQGQQRTDVLGVMGGGAYRAQLGPVLAQGSAALLFGGIAYSTTFSNGVRSPTLYRVLPGLRVGLGAEVGLGPGGMVLEVAYSRMMASDLDLGPEGNVGGISVEVGYLIYMF